MTLSPRQLANRLGINELAAAQAAYARVQSVTDFLRSPAYFARGYRYGRHIPRVMATSAAPREATSPLEAYAEAHTEGPGLYKWQHYFDIYDRHLRRFRGGDVHVVEIGVAGGGSLGMWREYLGPEARICGVDVDPECKRFEAGNTEVVIGDQSSHVFWQSFLESHERIDVVIDDGGHLPDQQAVTLECLLPAIRPGGVYICEDIHGPFQPFHAYVDGLTRQLNTVRAAPAVVAPNPLQRQVASVHRYPILTVIELATREPTEFECRRYGSIWPEAWASPSGLGTRQ